MVVVESAHLIITVVFGAAARVEILAASVHRIYSLSLRSPHFEAFFNTFFDDFDTVFFAELLSLLTRLLLLLLVPEGVELTLFAHLLRILHVLQLLRLLELLFSPDLFLSFLDDVLPLVEVVNVPRNALGLVVDLRSASKSHHLLSVPLLGPEHLLVFLQLRILG
tara:strand:- start:67 stop:561 length:495 start_codon:yes stop_codon:yes gene_type:complete